MKLKKIIEKGYNDKCKKILRKHPFSLECNIYNIKVFDFITPKVEIFISLDLTYYRTIFLSYPLTHPVFEELFFKIETYKNIPWVMPVSFYCLFYCNPDPFLKNRLRAIYIYPKGLVLKMLREKLSNLKNFYYFVIYFIINEALKFKAR